MEAPDKIYMNVDKAGFVCWSNTQFVKPYSSTEYIRKDALLEWAKKELESARLTDIDEFSRGEIITLELIIKKLQSL